MLFPAGAGEVRAVFATSHSIFTRFNLKALLNTETELAAIAAPAMTGFKKPSAASGMPKIL